MLRSNESFNYCYNTDWVFSRISALSLLIRISLERRNQALNNGNWLVDLNHLKTDDQHSRVW